MARKCGQVSFTKSDCISFEYHWIIDNCTARFKFPSAKTNGGTSTSTAEFSSPASDALTFRMEPVFGDKNEFSLWLDVIITEDYKENITIHWKVSIIDNDGQKCCTRDCTIMICDSVKSWSPYMSFTDLPKSMANFISADDKLNLLFEISYITNHVTVDRQTMQLNARLDKMRSDSEKETLEALSRLINCQQNADVTILVGDTEFHAHRAILSSRSTTFQHIFAHCNDHTRVIIENVPSVEIFQQLLQFIYSGYADSIHLHAMELLDVAVKYRLEHLKSITEEHLIASLTPQNAIDYMINATRLNAHTLKDAAIHYIASNVRSVMKSTSWNTMIHSHTDLFNQVFHLVVNKQSQC